MISTLTGGGAGPVAGYIGLADFVFPNGKLRLFSTRKNALVPTAIADPAQPINKNNTMSIAFSSGGNYMVVGTGEPTNQSPAVTCLYAFSRSGNTFSALSVPGTITGAHRSVSITSDGTYFAANAKVYHNNGGSLTSLTVSGIGTRSAISRDGVFVASDKLVQSGGINTRSVAIAKRTGSGSTATFAEVQAITISSGSSGSLERVVAAAFSPDGNYLFVGTDASPFLRAYKYTAGTDTWAALSNQPPSGGTLPAEDIDFSGVSWSADSTFVAAATLSATFIYERSGDTFTHRATLNDSTRDGYRGGFHSSGNYYITGRGRIYKKNSASSWTTFSDLAGSPTNSTGAAFSL